MGQQLGRERQQDEQQPLQPNHMVSCGDFLLHGRNDIKEKVPTEGVITGKLIADE